MAMSKVFRIEFETEDGDTGSLTAHTEEEKDAMVEALNDDGYQIKEVFTIRE